MAAHGAFPNWLLDSKEFVTKSPEWGGFVEELYDAIQQQLKESHVQAFTDLTDPERQLFMERAARAIQGGQAYKDLYSRVGLSLDQHLNNEVGRQLLEEYPINTKTDLVLEEAQEGAISLLRKWPDMKSKLHICFNQPLPDNLRQVAWRLYLENTKVRKTYVDLLSNNPRVAISTLDLEISHKCEQLILSEPTFNSLKGSVGAFYGMKAVLSYYHALNNGAGALPDTEYLLIVPLVEVVSNSVSRREPAASHVVALLVEEFLTLIKTRPGCMVDSGSEVHDMEWKQFAATVAQHLQDKSQETAKALVDAYVPSKEKIVATQTGAKAILIEAIQTLTRPIIRSLFSGYLRMDTLLFIWDQYIIGMDTPGFHDDYLPVVLAIFLMLLKDKLNACQSPAAVETVLKSEGVRLKIPQFQYEMNKHFYKDLYAKLHQDDKAAMPVLDPTQANLYPPWVHWFHDSLPARTTPQERQQAREEREMERERLLQQQREEERRRKDEEEKDRREEERMFLEQQQEDKRRHEDERLYLEDQLEQEKQRRMEMERRAAAEIDQLRIELEDLKRRKMRSSDSHQSLHSTISRYLIPPPPSAATGSYVAPPIADIAHRTPQPSPGHHRQTQDAVNDFIHRVSNSFQKVAHGTGTNQQRLDDQTQDAIGQHRTDVMNAEIAVFGHTLQPGEFEAMSLDVRTDKADDIMDTIKEYMQQRRQLQLANK